MTSIEPWPSAAPLMRTPTVQFVSGHLVVYHMHTSPRNNAGFRTVAGFESDDERDAQMTRESDCDIAWVRPGRQKSGTQKNLDRRRRQASDAPKP